MRAFGFLGAVAACAAASCSGTGAADRGTFEPGNSGGDNGVIITTGVGGDGTATGGATGNSGGTSLINPGNQNDGDGGGCNDLHVKFEKLIPTVLLLVDESGSMFENQYPTGGAASRWVVLRNAILDPAGFLKTLDGKVRFGLATYTSDNNSLATCPIMAKTTITLGNAAAITAAYPGVTKPFSYKGDTPTAAAIKAGAKVLADVTEAGPKFIVLATDGDPDDCKQSDPNCGQDESVAETQSAYTQKIGTFVIGISDDVHAVFLQDIANAGAGLPVVRHTGPNCDPNQPPPYLGTYATAAGTNAMYYAPANQAAITTAFNTIIGSIRSCVLEMHGKIVLEKAGDGNVHLDGKELGFNDANGWKVPDPTHVELVGQACTQLNSEETPVVDITFPCDVYTPIN
jgi:von Willebrand factor type A domain